MHRSLLASILFLSLFSFPASAKELWVPIAGNAQGGSFFRTDLRILNPSFSKDITVSATYLPINQDNTSAAPVQVTVPKRQMLVYDNVVSALFSTGGFGAIRFVSSDDFVVTSRTFADNPCTDRGGIFGQFIPAIQASDAQSKGVVLQLSTSSDSSKGFRSNVGFANVNATTATVTLKLYGSANEILKTATLDLLPFGATIPSVPGIFGIPTLNVANEWVSYSSTLPVLGYGSVVDNKSADQIFITAAQDSGTEQTAGETKIVDVGPGISFSPATLTVKPGDTVQWAFHGFHSTTSNTQTGAENWDSGTMSSGTFSHTFTTPGTYKYYCTVHSTPNGTAMNGTITVQSSSPGNGGGYK
ncbi:MAG TPA: plastocyanin/azurin family copper-binding protein [Thermoanaerobaculia bacterium]|nr:plastocyanin/azurin family copper-binding protein [Thermoanaerobaculia bacterium]